ncbi:hypothetical protein ACQEUU_19250 [Nonomuraea sp. CA-218870]|uniref:Uncharacterized protein n=1 Tax=Nonomuraea corallina TaxID=2989783 RepID=A0ABT4SBG2_9ACTN|nr:hypothetical protein [Nonomuraea corallina]MDA0634519.1 hypothetical protein [Nonomuraea corallina]
MVKPQQPELRRSGKGATDTDSAQAIPEKRRGSGGHAHGTDKGRKGGGKGGGVPPGQQPPHPS